MLQMQNISFIDIIPNISLRDIPVCITTWFKIKKNFIFFYSIIYLTFQDSLQLIVTKKHTIHLIH